MLNSSWIKLWRISPHFYTVYYQKYERKQLGFYLKILQTGNKLQGNWLINQCYAIIKSCFIEKSRHRQFSGRNSYDLPDIRQNYQLLQLLFHHQSDMASNLTSYQGGELGFFCNESRGINVSERTRSMKVPAVGWHPVNWVVLGLACLGR